MGSLRAATGILASVLMLSACGGSAADDGATGSTSDAGGAQPESAETFVFEPPAGSPEVPVDPQRIVTLQDQVEPTAAIGGEVRADLCQRVPVAPAT